mmetsp:Transcript_19965/g.79610  ORF Transcript_19965/g.79610 Transcript_19965/m.79610 type:complete len:245 (-) Transcript_19965:511-1245(-)
MPTTWRVSSTTTTCRVRVLRKSDQTYRALVSGPTTGEDLLTKGVKSTTALAGHGGRSSTCGKWGKKSRASAPWTRSRTTAHEAPDSSAAPEAPSGAGRPPLASSGSSRRLGRRACMRTTASWLREMRPRYVPSSRSTGKPWCAVSLSASTRSAWRADASTHVTWGVMTHATSVDHPRGGGDTVINDDVVERGESDNDDGLSGTPTTWAGLLFASAADAPTSSPASSPLGLAWKKCSGGSSSMYL